MIRTVLLILVFAAGCSRSAGQSSAPPEGLLPTGDTLRICRPSDSPAFFLQTFSSDDRTLDRLFPNGVLERIEADTSNGRELQRHLATLAGVPDSSFKGSGASYGFHQPLFTIAFLTDGGDGLGIDIKADSVGLDVTLCGVRDSVATTHFTPRRMVRGESWLLRLNVDGRPHVAVFRCIVATAAEKPIMQRVFRKAVEDGASSNQANFDLRTPPLSVAQCLGVQS